MPRRRKNANFWESAKYNNSAFMEYYNRLTELSISMFKWTNVPDSIDVRFLELILFGDGMSVFFKDEVMGYLALRCTIGGRLDVYQIPTERRAYASNGYQMELDETNSDIIFNNKLHTNSVLTVENYSRRLWNLDRTIDVNCNAQKTPVLITCDETQRLTLKNVYMQYEGNQPVIYGDKQLNPKSLQVLRTDAPFLADKLYLLKTQLWNEALTYLGISNVNMTKKERLISDEVIRNQGGVIANRNSRLKERQEACKKINKMFGLDIWCEFEDDIVLTDDEDYEENMSKDAQEEGEPNE